MEAGPGLSWPRSRVSAGGGTAEAQLLWKVRGDSKGGEDLARRGNAPAGRGGSGFITVPRQQSAARAGAQVSVGASGTAWWGPYGEEKEVGPGLRRPEGAYQGGD
ncbi:hypothetical protein NDU88_001795 [Pleurodeles waltl]|uniref:Uncharacterized protein n=1 Tax=Pleurodeles waltl TaxID=8319 RepID=A0AAV7LE77_PLEWA|nr:hypothetical protein NDU88_001795 [Pleurodeles waltl]